MTWPSYRWTILFGAVGGGVAAVLFHLFQQVPYPHDMPVHRVAHVLWPSGFWLLATKGIEDTLEAWFIIALSIGANAALYAVVGTVLSLFRRRRSPGHRARA